MLPKTLNKEYESVSDCLISVTFCTQTLNVSPHVPEVKTGMVEPTLRGLPRDKTEKCPQHDGPWTMWCHVKLLKKRLLVSLTTAIVVTVL